MAETTITRRNAVALAAGSAIAGTVGLAAARTVRADEAPADARPVGTRYTQASNLDEIGIVHEAAASEEFDVVVVGSGISGVVATMIAAEQAPDAKILLVEARSYCGGGTNFAEQADMPAVSKDWTAALQVGAQTAAASDFVKDGLLIAERESDIGKNSTWLFSKHAVSLTIKNVARAHQLIEEGGELKFQRFAGYAGGDGSQTIAQLVDEIETAPAYANVEIRLETRGSALLLDDEYTVAGIQLKNADGSYTDVAAKAVVLSCGGMSNNLELLQNYSNQELDHCVSVNQGHYGDGMVMAEQTAHGRCKTIALSSMLGYVDGFDYQSWLGIAAGDNPTALFVNQDGIRFCNEDMSSIEGVGNVTIEYSKAVEGQGRVYSIMGSNLLDFYKENRLPHPSGFYGKGQAERPFDLDAELEEYAGNENVFKADTLEELAGLIDVPVDALVQTVEQYDADAASGEGDSVFLKSADYTVAIGDAPYYAFKLCSLIVNTNAGIRVNRNCQVVDQDWNPVKGLYATGIGISGFVTDVYEVGQCQCVSIWSGSKAARTLVEQDLGGTVAADWFGDHEWGVGELPTFVNWDEYEAYVPEESKK